MVEVEVEVWGGDKYVLYVYMCRAISAGNIN